MALGFQRQGIFGRKPVFPQDDILSNGPYGTPGIGDGLNQRMFGGQDMEPVNSNPNAMPIGVKEITKKPGFFGKDSMLWKVLGTLGDAFSDGPPIYTQSILQQRDAEERARMAQQQRMQKREDLQWEWQNKPKDVNPYRWESNDGSLMEIGPDGQPRQVYKDPTPKVTYMNVDNADGTKTVYPVVNGQIVTGGQPSGLIPIGGTLPPKGGSGGNVTGGFR